MLKLFELDRSAHPRQLCVFFTYHSLESIQSGGISAAKRRPQLKRSCTHFSKTQERQQGGEDRGISEGQQAGCRQVMTFKALVNLPFPGSAPSVCFLAVGTSVNELRGCVRRLKTTRSLSQLSSRQTSSSHCKNQNKPNPLQRFSKTFKTWSPNTPQIQCKATWWEPLNNKRVISLAINLLHFPY